MSVISVGTCEAFVLDCIICLVKFIAMEVAVNRYEVSSTLRFR